VINLQLNKSKPTTNIPCKGNIYWHFVHFTDSSCFYVACISICFVFIVILTLFSSDEPLQKWAKDQRFGGFLRLHHQGQRWWQRQDNSPKHFFLIWWWRCWSSENIFVHLFAVEVSDLIYSRLVILQRTELPFLLICSIQQAFSKRVVKGWAVWCVT
jgi:hypothetical protein